MRARSRIPDTWPRGMRAEVAAAYVGLGASTFLREVKVGRAPQPEPLTDGCAVWLRDDLDDWLDQRFRRTTSPVEAPAAASDGSEWMRALGDAD